MRKTKTKISPGDVFGRLTALERAENRGIRTFWKARCECGNEVEVSGSEMSRTDRAGSKSCGCLSKEVHSKCATTHGMVNSPEYKTWAAVKNRCNNATHSHYAYYGGRGITYDAKWESFEVFLADMGSRPEGCTLDRIDNNGNYCKENCRWSTPKEQARNRSNNVLHEWNGESAFIGDIADEVGIKKSTLSERLKSGMTITEAVNAPVREWRKKKASERNKQYQAAGESMTLSEWSKKLGIAMPTIISRMEAGKTFERAIAKKTEHLELTKDGITLPLVEWAKRVGYSPQAVRFRIKQGWSHEAALTTPLK